MYSENKPYLSASFHSVFRANSYAYNAEAKRKLANAALQKLCPGKTVKGL